MLISTKSLKREQVLLALYLYAVRDDNDSERDCLYIPRVPKPTEHDAKEEIAENLTNNNDYFFKEVFLGYTTKKIFVDLSDEEGFDDTLYNYFYGGGAAKTALDTYFPDICLEQNLPRLKVTDTVVISSPSSLSHRLLSFRNSLSFRSNSGSFSSQSPLQLSASLSPGSPPSTSNRKKNWLF